jgi:hypothetical protein
MQFGTLKSMQHLMDRTIHVLRSCVHLGCRFVSVAKWEPLEEALQSAGLRKASAEPGPRLGGHAKQELLASNPWLLSFLDEQHKVSTKTVGGDGSRGAKVAKDVAVPEDSDSDGIDEEEVLNELYKKRAELADGAPRLTPDFSVVLLGGSWTLRHLDVPFDAFKGRATSGDVEAWCVRWGFQKSMRFSVSLFSEATAQEMAKSWCGAMQHWHDLSLTSSEAEFSSALAPKWTPTEEFEAIRRDAVGPLAARCQQILSMQPGVGV